MKSLCGFGIKATLGSPLEKDREKEWVSWEVEWGDGKENKRTSQLSYPTQLSLNFHLIHVKYEDF